MKRTLIVVVAIVLINLAVVWFTGAYAGPFVSLGAGFRDQFYSVSLGWQFLDRPDVKAGVEYEFNDTGDMGPGYPNINRFENVNAVVRSRLYRDLWGFGKIGVTSNRRGYNGALNNYKASGAFNGYNAGVGLEYEWSRGFYVWAMGQVYYYESPSNPDTEGVAHPSMGIRLEF